MKGRVELTRFWRGLKFSALKYDAPHTFLLKNISELLKLVIPLEDHCVEKGRSGS